ncbi:NUDIX hydrolase [Kushneria aurantia]|uniref:NUDIX hydrolase n=1 Tax=Kushneria aurantia TaxID=504092 RepID=A0ABV6G8M4_9GAMM|nr:NUDIX domain-containing protein [Kushneria aurantia]
MMPANVRVQLVNTRNQPVGTARRCEMRRLRMWHRAVYIFVLNSEGALCVQRRTTIKDIFPGYRDLCAGGVVDAGESFHQAAARELAEELGLKLPLTYCGEQRFADGMNAFGSVYLAHYEGQSLHLQASEVESVEWLAPQAALAVEDATPDSRQALALLIERGWIAA